MGYCLNRLDEPVFIAVPKPVLTEFGILYKLESCALFYFGTTCNKGHCQCQVPCEGAEILVEFKTKKPNRDIVFVKKPCLQ